MISSMLSRLVILVFGNLYPAYASYKAVKTKNVKEYVRWMMYWIVFALFTCVETITDIFLSFWFPFYYELKIVVVLWLLSPATRGSSILYRQFVHPALNRREQEIDECITKAKEQGYSTVLQLGTKGMSMATSFIMQTAFKVFQHGDPTHTVNPSPAAQLYGTPALNTPAPATIPAHASFPVTQNALPRMVIGNPGSSRDQGGGELMSHLRRTQSLGDLGVEREGDVNRNNKALPAIANQRYDESDNVEEMDYYQAEDDKTELYFTEVDVPLRRRVGRSREKGMIDFSHIRSSEDVSYRGEECPSGPNSQQQSCVTSLSRTGSVGSSRVRGATLASSSNPVSSPTSSTSAGPVRKGSFKEGIPGPLLVGWYPEDGMMGGGMPVMQVHPTMQPPYHHPPPVVTTLVTNFAPETPAVPPPAVAPPRAAVPRPEPTVTATPVRQPLIISIKTPSLKQCLVTAQSVDEDDSSLSCSSSTVSEPTAIEAKPADICRTDNSSTQDEAAFSPESICKQIDECVAEVTETAKELSVGAEKAVSEPQCAVEIKAKEVVAEDTKIPVRVEDKKESDIVAVTADEKDSAVTEIKIVEKVDTKIAASEDNAAVKPESETANSDSVGNSNAVEVEKSDLKVPSTTVSSVSTPAVTTVTTAASETSTPLTPTLSPSTASVSPIITSIESTPSVANKAVTATESKPAVTNSVASASVTGTAIKVISAVLNDIAKPPMRPTTPPAPPVTVKPSRPLSCGSFSFNDAPAIPPKKPDLDLTIAKPTVTDSRKSPTFAGKPIPEPPVLAWHPKPPLSPPTPPPPPISTTPEPPKKSGGKLRWFKSKPAPPPPPSPTPSTRSTHSTHSTHSIHSAHSVAAAISSALLGGKDKK